METNTHSDVRKLVEQLPAARLPAAYELLRELAERGETLQSQLEFKQLPIAKRRQILASQAEELAGHYAQTSDERSEWQAGDFLNEDSTG
jgi:hypothetical protein